MSGCRYQHIDDDGLVICDLEPNKNRVSYCVPGGCPDREDQLEPCPFCGTKLVYEEFVARALPGAPLLRYFGHGKTGCLMDCYELSPDDVPAWNRRRSHEADTV